MDLEKARVYFEAGSLAGAEIQPAQMGAGWVVELRQGSGERHLLSVARTTRHKVYKTLEAAAADARRLGFRSVTVYLVR